MEGFKKKKSNRRRYSEQPNLHGLHQQQADSRANRSFSPTSMGQTDHDIEDDFKQTLAQMYWETKADMLSITEDSLKLKMRIKEIKQQFLHALMQYEEFERAGAGIRSDYIQEEYDASDTQECHGILPEDMERLRGKYKDVEFISDDSDNMGLADRGSAIRNSTSSKQRRQNDSDMIEKNNNTKKEYEKENQHIKHMMQQESLSSIKKYVDSYEIDVDESIDMQMQRVRMRKPKSRKPCDGFNNDDSHGKSLMSREEFMASNEVIDSVNESAESSQLKQNPIMTARIYNIIQPEVRGETIGGGGEQLNNNFLTKPVLNEIGQPIINPLLKEWLISQQKMQSEEISFATEQKLEQIRANSLMESFPDMTGNETYFRPDMSSCMLEWAAQHQIDSTTGSVPKLSNISSSILQKSLSSLEGQIVGAENYRSAIVNQTYASENSSNMEDIVINQVDFPSQVESMQEDSSVPSLPIELLPPTINSPRRTKKPTVNQSPNILNNLNYEAKSKDARYLSPTRANIPTKAHSPKPHNVTSEWSFEHSLKDISDITKISDLTTSRLQLSQVQTDTSIQKPVKNVQNSPTSNKKKDKPPQHSTPEKNIPVVMETPKYEHSSRQPLENSKENLGSRPSPTGSDSNTPKASVMTPTQTHCHHQNSSSACSCYDDNSTTPVNTRLSSRTRRSLGFRQSLGGSTVVPADWSGVVHRRQSLGGSVQSGGEWSGSNDEGGNDQTPVVCRHGRVRAKMMYSNSSENQSGSSGNPPASGSPCRGSSREQFLYTNQDGSRCNDELFTNQFQGAFKRGISMVGDKNNNSIPEETEATQPDDPGASMEATRDSDAHASQISIPHPSLVEHTSSDISVNSMHMSGLSSCQESSYKETDNDSNNSAWSNGTASSTSHRKYIHGVKANRVVSTNPSAASSTSDIRAPTNSPNSTDTGNQASASSANFPSSSSMESLSSGGLLLHQQRAMLIAQARSMDGLDSKDSSTALHQTRSVDGLDSKYSTLGNKRNTRDAYQSKRVSVQRSSSTRPPCIGKEATGIMRQRARSHSFREAPIGGKPCVEVKPTRQDMPPPVGTMAMSAEYKQFRSKVLHEKPTGKEIPQDDDSLATDNSYIDIDQYERKRKPTLLRKIKNIGRHLRHNSRQKAYVYEAQNAGSSGNE